MKSEHYSCNVALGSVTEAMKAQRVLSSAAVSSEVIKVDRSRRGCVYGVSFPCVQRGQVLSLLSAAGFSVKDADR